MKDYGKTFWTFTGLILFAVSAQLVRAQSDTVSLAPASKLIGMDLRTNDDRQAGTIEYLMIEGNSGDVRLALVSPGGELELEEGQLVAVPFSNLDVRSVEDQEIVATVSLAQLQGATTIAEDEVSTLAEPLVVTEVYDYYGTPEERNRMQMRSGDNQGAMSEDRQPQNRPPQSNQPDEMNQRPEEDDPLANLREEHDTMEMDQEAVEDIDEEEYREEQAADMDADVDADMDADPQGGVQADVDMEADADLDMQDEYGDEERTAGVVEEEHDTDAQMADRREEERQAQQQGSQAMSQQQGSQMSQQQGRPQDQGQSQQQREAPADHMVLVARNVVSVVIPGLQPAEQMLGAPVRTPSDEEFGDIDEVVLNLDENRVAYVLISHGGFLGIGEEWFAMPIEKLQWNAQEQRFTTDVDAESVEVFRGLPKSDLPASVSKSELDDFYRSYGVTRTDDGMSSENRDRINQ